MTAHTQEATAKGGENQREEGKEGFNLSEEEQTYYVEAIKSARWIVKDATGKDVAGLTAEVFAKIAQNLFWVRTEGVQVQKRAKAQEAKSAKVQESGEDRHIRNVKEAQEKDRLRQGAEAYERRRKEGEPYEKKRRSQAERCEGGNCGEEEITEYEAPASINDILGVAVEVLDIQEVEEGGFGGFDLQFIRNSPLGNTKRENIRTYSKVLGGQIQHLKDTDKLPALGEVEKRQSGKTGRSYFNFSSSSFMIPRDPRTKPIFAGDQARTLADEEAEIKEFMDY